MNHYAVRQRIDGKWDFTCNGHPTGCCRAYKIWSEEEIKLYYLTKEELNEWEVFKDKHHDCGHNTKEEAQNCYREFLLDQRLQLNHKDTNSQRQCQVCNEWTQGFAVLDGFQVFTLCDQHRNKESVGTLFKEVGEIWSS